MYCSSRQTISATSRRHEWLYINKYKYVLYKLFLHSLLNVWSTHTHDTYTNVYTRTHVYTHMCAPLQFTLSRKHTEKLNSYKVRLHSYNSREIFSFLCPYHFMHNFPLSHNNVQREKAADETGETTLSKLKRHTQEWRHALLRIGLFLYWQ
jgi:hypothetical protein